MGKTDSILTGMRAQFIGALSTLELLAVFLHDPKEKTAYLRCLLEGDMQGLDKHFFRMYVDLVSRNSYDIEDVAGRGIKMAPKLVVRPQRILTILEARKALSNKMPQACVIDSNTTAEQQISHHLSNLRRGKLNALKNVLDLLKGLGSQAVPAADIRTKRILSDRGTYNIADMDAMSRKHVSEIRLDVQNKNKHECIRTELMEFASNDSAFSVWERELLRSSTVGLSYVPWVYFDTNVFLNVPDSINYLLLQKIASGLDEPLPGIKQTLNANKAKSIIHHHKMCKKSPLVDQEVLDIFFRGYVYDIVLYCARGTLSSSYFEMKTSALIGLLSKMRGISTGPSSFIQGRSFFGHTIDDSVNLKAADTADTFQILYSIAGIPDILYKLTVKTRQ